MSIKKLFKFKLLIVEKFFNDKEFFIIFFGVLFVFVIGVDKVIIGLLLKFWFWNIFERNGLFVCMILKKYGL